MGKRLLVLLLVTAAASAGAGAEPGGRVRGLVLVTLDTTRADALDPQRTPNLERLAAAGVRYTRAVAPTPLTLPSHTTVLTGLLPPQHGLRTNGHGRLPDDVGTLATRLRDAGWTTAAVVGSLVLDRRFGLAGGFDHYDDRMAAERLGQYGHAERDAAAVTDAALAWLAARTPSQPYLLWVHYYDPHAPYGSHEVGGDPRAAYAAEVAHVDHHLGRLLATTAEDVVVAVAGDHGEAFGEHGETGHGVLLHGATLNVPLLLAGPGLPAGTVVHEPVGLERLAATLLALVAPNAPPLGAAAPLPLRPGRPSDGARGVYSETLMPARVYGWSPLLALTTARWRYVAGLHGELYDLAADAGEARDVATAHPTVVREMAAELARLGGASVEPDPAPGDAELAAALASLGYLGVSSPAGGGLDPRRALAVLDELERARSEIAAGRPAAAVARLERLLPSQPANVPLLAQLARARRAAGDGAGALRTWRRALELDPGSVFLRLDLARTLDGLGHATAARAAYREVLALDPRAAAAWLGAAGLARDDAAAAAILREALAAGTDSILVLVRVAQLEPAAADAEELLERAAALAPEAALPLVELGRRALARGDVEVAERQCAAAAAREPLAPAPALCRGETALADGRRVEAMALARRALTLAGDDDPAAAAAARDLLSRARRADHDPG